MPEKILIVDDDLDTLKLVGLILQRQGYQIIAASGGAQAMAKAAAERPDMILLDLMMPDMDGYEVTRRLRADANLSQTPIIMFTAKTMLDDKVAGFEAGADDYLTKPTHPSELIAHVKALLARAQATRASQPLAERGHTLGVIGSKGGVGVTTVALNLAAIASQTGHDTIVADLNPGSGSLSVMMGMLQSESLSGLVTRAPGDINARAVVDRLISHASGLRALAPPPLPADRNLVNNVAQLETVAKLLGTACRLAVVDLGAGLTEASRRIVTLCELLILVTEPSRLGVAHAKAMLTDLVNAGVAGPRIEVVLVNRAPSSVQMSWQQAEQLLGHKIVSIITPAAELAHQAVEAGSPMVLLRPDTLAADQIRQLATHSLQKLRL